MKRNSLLFAILSLSTLLKAQIIITEVMQSNIDCKMDDLNEFPDSWVEIYNSTTTMYITDKFSIGETRDATKAWVIPSVKITPKSHLLIYCDNEANELHTDFRLDTGKGASVYLFKNDAIIDSVIMPKKMPAPNISYGRLSDNSSEWGYQTTPTPNKENCKSFCEEILGEPIFSMKGGVFTNTKSTTLELTLPDDAPAGTEIRVTYDGSEPTATSTLYQKPISISASCVVKAKLFKEGYLSPRSTTHSYIFFPREMTLPVISISTNKEYLYDNKIGIYVDGTYSNKKKNYEHDWRRPINLELFDQPNQESVLNQLCETRVSGAASRGCKLKSFALYSNKRFGEKKFKYEFFPDQRPGQTNFKSLVLRNAGNDFDYLYMRDAIAQLSLAKYTDMDYQAWRPAIIYINGEYTGILNIRERGNANNIYTNYDELEDVDVAENWGIKEGDDVNLNAFKEFFNEHGHTWDEYSKWMDLDEFINFWIMNCYFNNVDFPGNNLMMWRPRTEDGRWRFIAKDVDYILGIYNAQGANYAYINWLYDNNFDPNTNWANKSSATRLFRRLMEDEDFKHEFTSRFAIYMGDFLNYDRIWQDIWSPMHETIKTEYPHHRKLINQWWPNYDSELSSAKSWLKQRTDFMYKHIADYCKLGTPCKLSINENITDSEKDAITVSLNGISLSKKTFNGKMYESCEITLLPGVAEDGASQVNGWDIREISSKGAVTISHVDTPEYTFSMPNCSSLTINATFGEYNSIDAPEIATLSPITDGNVTYYNTNGIKTNSLTKGINIVRTSDGKAMKVLY